MLPYVPTLLLSTLPFPYTSSSPSYLFPDSSSLLYLRLGEGPGVGRGKNNFKTKIFGKKKF